MILVNGNWEKIEDLQDCLQIIEQNLGKEFTEKFVSVLLKQVDIDNVMLREAINTLNDYITFDEFRFYSRRNKV